MGERVPDSGKGLGTKRCPRCGEVLFEDMDVCYGCLYDFTREQKAEGLPPDASSAFARDGAVVYNVPWEVSGIPPGDMREDELEPVPASLPADDASGLSVRIKSESMEVTLPLPQDGLLVGRGNVCDVILHEPAVSRHHVRIVPRGHTAVVEDCGSTNRARLRGKEVASTTTMEVGDVLDVCGTLFFLLDGRVT